MRGQKRRRSMPVGASLSDERGAAMAEYAPLLALLALAVIVSLSFFGPWVVNHLGIGGLSIEYGDHVAGECPTDWGMAHVNSPEAQEKKNSQSVNQNGDNYVCIKSPSGGGGGNTGNNTNAKDNNSDPVGGG